MAMINSLHLVVVHTSSEETQSQRNSLRDGYCQYHVRVIFLTLSDAVCQFPSHGRHANGSDLLSRSLEVACPCP